MQHTTIPSRRTDAIRRDARRGRAGFTLLETMLAVLIVAIGVLAAVDAQLYFDRSNRWSSKSTAGMYLANEIRQLMVAKPRHENSGIAATPGSDAGESATGAGFLDPVSGADDIDDFHNVTFGPALGSTIAPGERVATSGAVIASGQVITDVRLLTTASGAAGTLTGITLQDWSQHVTVEKVSPYDISSPIAWSASVPASATRPGFPVDGCPLRVRVDVYYRPVGIDPQERDRPVATLTWIVMPQRVQ